MPVLVEDQFRALPVFSPVNFPFLHLAKPPLRF
jgi:hypothetical protein